MPRELLVGRFCPRPRKRRDVGVAVYGQAHCSLPPAAVEGLETWGRAACPCSAAPDGPF